MAFECRSIAICVRDLCCDSSSGPQDFTVRVEPTNIKFPVCDPETGEMISGHIPPISEQDVTDSCVCTCPLPVNVMASDPTKAIGGGYKLFVAVGGRTVVNGVAVHIDGDAAYTTAECGGVPLCEVLAEPGTLPAPVTFCDAVKSCLIEDKVIDNGNGTFTHTGIFGTAVTVDICAAINASCPATAVDNGNGTYTITGTDGTSITIDVTRATVAINPDGSVTVTDDDGNAVTIPADTPATIVDNGNGTATTTGTDGVSATTLTSALDPAAGNLLTANAAGQVGITAADVCAAVAATCAPTLTRNGDGTYLFDDGHGTTSVLDINEIDADIKAINVVGSVVTFTAEDGSTVSLDICAIVNANCGAKIVANADGSFTVTGNDGLSQTIPAPPVVTATAVANPDGSVTVTGTDGNAVTIPADTPATIVDNGNGTATTTGTDGVSATTLTSALDPAAGNLLSANAAGQVGITAADVCAVVTTTDGGAFDAATMKVVGDDCKVHSFGCAAPSDGTISIGGLKIGVKRYIENAFLDDVASNTVVFDATSAAGASVVIGTVSFTTPDNCTPTTSVYFSGAVSMTRGVDAGGNIRLQVEASIDGGAWFTVSAGGLINTSAAVAPNAFNEWEMSLGAIRKLAPGAHVARYRVTLLSGPGIGVAALAIRKQGSLGIIDSGIGLVCCG